MYSVVDLFAGAGGLSLGFQQTKKYDIKVAFENNPVMQETYKQNHPNVEVKGDVCAADYQEIQQKYGRIDVVIGGPPCQGFSNANRQKNQAISRNNSLVKEYIRAIVELKPKAFVMENVSMLQSDVHRFYLSNSDLKLVENNLVETKNTGIMLLDKMYIFDGALEIVKDEGTLRKYQWPDLDYLELNVIYKATQNQSKLDGVLAKHKTKLLFIAHKYMNEAAEGVIERANHVAFEAVNGYFEGAIEKEDIRRLVEPAVMYQRMVRKALEIFENNLVVDGYDQTNGLFAEIRSFAVFDYLKAILGTGEGEDGYTINANVLSATHFGAPQKRMRFVVMGIRKDVATEIKLPEGQFKDGPYRTVRDAIEDLADEKTVFDLSEDIGISIQRKEDLSELAKSLRDSDVLRNHLITKTGDVAMKRFKALKQGENFHALEDSLKTNTYTDVTRTQNTIYLRLNYDEPSGTVVNVRKSMWIHPTEDRAISVREAARLQTFPDSFVFCGSKDKQYQQVGNAVPPIMAKAIAKKLAAQLRKALPEE